MNTEIAKVENTFTALAIDGEAFRRAAEMNLAGETANMNDLDRIKMPTADNSYFTITQLEGEVTEKEFSAIIIAHKTARSYFPGVFSGSGTAPTCSSSDGYKSTTGKLCVTCEFSKFGSDGKNGQACRLSELLFVLLPHGSLPQILSVPPSSLKPLKKYFLRLTSQQLAFNEVLTRFSTTKAQSKDGIKFSMLELNLDKVLDADDRTRIQAYTYAMAPLLRGSVGADGSTIHEEDTPDISAYEAEVSEAQPLESGIPF